MEPPLVFRCSLFCRGSVCAALPLNFIFLIFSPERAINLSIILHTALLGISTQFWLIANRRHPLACFIGSISLMFGGAFFLHIYAGHLSNICTMAWAPLILLVVDKLFESFNLKYILFGAFVITMQIFAGHPQYVFYTAITALIYFTFKLMNTTEKRKKIIFLPLIYLIAALLSAVQFLAMFFGTSETLRGENLSYSLASMFSFPIENLMTMISPYFFGTIDNYWGRSYLWEMCLYGGITSLLLAFYGAVEEIKKKKFIHLSCLIILFILALGKHTPLFSFLYNWIFGFSRFRSISKFIFFAQIFITYFVALGAHKLIDENKISKMWLKFYFGFSLALVSISVFILYKDWKSVIEYIYNFNETYNFREILNDNKLIYQFKDEAFKSILSASLIVFFITLLLYLSNRYSKLKWIILTIALLESLVFACNSLTGFDPSVNPQKEVESYLISNSKNYRILNTSFKNFALSSGLFDIWGADPIILTRYADFINWTQNNSLVGTQYVNFSKENKLYRMLRLKNAIFFSDNSFKVSEVKDPLPQALLVNQFDVLSDRESIFQAMAKSDFDPAQKVILESKPPFLPKTNIGDVSVIDQGADYLNIKVDIKESSLLLITDSFAKDWKVNSLVKLDDRVYKILPANYILKAIPLEAGHHRIQLAYEPWWFKVGIYISCISWFIFIFFVFKKDLKFH